ncbi:hypothetical protein ADK53_33650 [Streptomyces sp. WM6373]|uniref:DUF2017 domain-containing protein n=1 Tax=Streptomyces TaxID=1883 RepID=UPI0004CA2A95|nr:MULTISPECIES: DUF2017 domain-containing protein [unclassified Streptomyces]KJY17478.1 hypothetical protein VR43_29575 [Streptomyces sp. NRRL S-104]KOU28907.1 hypothetical protein ADK53_33650 [Streptomyces sp. WM6373]KOU58167.1 hypothetical protein ADK96_35285 [Streptomyces sp. IGB124]KOU70529.1 hypothetical protein ADK61_34135 [Streptomyces sp. XY66]KOU80514.1 hypothetical protein ADK93_32765 [Streptomyces sp. XY58]
MGRSTGMFESLKGGGAAIALDEIEISILRSLAVQMLELIGPGEPEPAEDADPLAALFAADGPTEPPSDPALARLFPDAYGSPDGAGDEGVDPVELKARAAEFRRYTENDLRTRKREDALALVRSLDALTPAADGAAVLELTGELPMRWLGGLNDLRLTLAARLDITEDDESAALFRLPDDDPRKPMVMAYLWLGGLQESLIETL